MAGPLVIVESPAKARKIQEYLGDDFTVTASIGHIRDLPRNADEVPAAYKSEPWARIGIDTDNGFKPLYIVPTAKKKVVSELKAMLKDADELYLATDEDREGEAIAWHLTEVLNPRVPTRRMVFHEITREAIQRALDEPRDVDYQLVDAQESRRLLDRLYGYEVSPVLWKKVRPRLSAGRVQSVATRLVVERERARMAFVSADWWDLEGTFAPAGNGNGSGDGSSGAAPDTAASFPGKLAAVDGAPVVTGKDFDDRGRLTKDGAVRLDEDGAVALRDGLADADFAVRSVESKPYTRKPYAPFITSTLQVEAGRKLRFASARTMQIAQNLYENGYITYMRTDSTALSETALSAARSQIREKYGPDYLPDAPRVYAKQAKGAQEAHEAIRPAGETFRTPDQVRGELGGDALRLYDLIWTRTVASQMTDARGRTVSVRLGATAADGRDAEFAASGKTVDFPGFLRAYVEGSDDPDAELEDQERILPPLEEGQRLSALELDPSGHATKPPARFTEASLVRRLEELGVGRPSTYAATISTIIDREYVWKKGSALVPSLTAFAVVSLLEQHFPDLVDYAFTARMEADLDAIAAGAKERVPWLSHFYFGQYGNDDGGFALKEKVEDQLGEIDARAVNSIPIGEDPDGVEIVARSGRYGPYLARGEDTASIPDDLAPDEITVDRALEILSQPRDGNVLGDDPETGLPVIAKAGRFGPYVQLGEMVEGGEKPKTSSLFQTMTLERITLDDALQLLSLPRTVGVHPETGEEILALNGRYGPYLKSGKETRSIDNEEQLLTITLDEAVKKLAEPKRRGRQAKPPLKELGADPATDKPMVLKDGRFGPYVTDGETNASLRAGDTVEDLTPERAAELLADRRAAGPAKKRGKKAKKKATKKKTTKKKSTAKKSTAKKSTTKKAGTKKAATAASGEAGDDQAPSEAAPDSETT